jgi:hypothetical protein
MTNDEKTKEQERTEETENELFLYSLGFLLFKDEGRPWRNFSN